MSGQYQLAIPRLERVLAKDSLHLQARFLLADSHLRTGDTTQAIGTLEKVIGMTGDSRLEEQVIEYIHSITDQKNEHALR